MEVLLLVFFSILIVVSCQDIRRMEIKDGCHIAIAVLAAAAILIAPDTDILSRLSGALCISVPMVMLTLMVPGAFGGGDIKLMAASGLFLGWKVAVVSAALALFAAGGYALFLIVKKKADKGQRFPLGPFLSIGLAVSALFGESIWQLWLSW